MATELKLRIYSMPYTFTGKIGLDLGGIWRNEDFLLKY
jgi:hypothetical protein